MNSARFIALAALCLTGCLLAPDEPFCDFAEDCAECTGRDGCGWCPGRGCVDGNSLGPDEGICADWRWDDCTVAVDPCRVHALCDRCVLATGCAWCPGDGCSAFGQACGGGVATCDEPAPCGARTTCEACTDDGLCEWDNRGIVYCSAFDCPGFTTVDDGCLPRTFCL